VLDLAERDVRTLSGGERQRVAIAAMLAQDTPLLLLDEPANALDLAHQSSVMRLLGRLCREQGKAAIMIGHDLGHAHHASSHALLLMGDGEWQAGPVDDVMQGPILSRYLGHPIEVIPHGTRRLFVPTEEFA
jgi:iron complex transport system ATP-binding protein